MEETTAQALEALEACYQAFITKLEKSKASSVGEVMGNFFRAQGNPRVAYAVEEFDDLLTHQVAALAGLLEGCPAEEAAAVAVQALEQMLFYPIPRDRNTAFSLAAFEGRAQPLLPFLPPDKRREMASRYARRTPPRDMLPNQKKLWNTLSLG